MENLTFEELDELWLSNQKQLDDLYDIAEKEQDSWKWTLLYANQINPLQELNDKIYKLMEEKF